MLQITGFETIVSLINIHILLLQMFPGKLRKIAAAIMFTAAAMCSLLIYFLPSDELKSALAMILMLFVVFSPLITVKGLKKKQIAYLTFLYIGVSSSISIAFFGLANSFGLDAITKLRIEVAINCLSLLFGPLMVKANSKFNILSRTAMLPSWSKGLLISVVWFCDIFATISSKFFEDIPKTPRAVVTEFLVMISLTALAILCPLLLSSVASYVYHKSVSKALNDQLEVQVEYYVKMLRNNEDLRHFKHDYANIKEGIAVHIPFEEYPQLRKLFGDLDLDILAKGPVFSTSNPVIDAFLSKKQLSAQKCNAEISFSGLVPNGIISDKDLFILFGTAVDNALDACSALPQDASKRINIKADFHDGVFLLNITNPTLRNVKIHNNMISTTKQDKKSHGFGIPSMQKIVDAYSGDMELSYNDNIFCLNISLEVGPYNNLHQSNIVSEKSVIMAKTSKSQQSTNS